MITVAATRARWLGRWGNESIYYYKAKEARSKLFLILIFVVRTNNY
jgi:hypothetical protein